MLRPARAERSGEDDDQRDSRGADHPGWRRGRGSRAVVEAQRARASRAHGHLASGDAAAREAHSHRDAAALSVVLREWPESGRPPARAVTGREARCPGGKALRWAEATAGGGVRARRQSRYSLSPVSYTHLRAHE